MLVLPSVIPEYLDCSSSLPPHSCWLTEDGGPAWESHQTWIQTPLHPCESSLGIFSTSFCLRFSSHLKCGETSVPAFFTFQSRSSAGHTTNLNLTFLNPSCPTPFFLTFKQVTSFQLSVLHPISQIECTENVCFASKR